MSKSLVLLMCFLGAFVSASDIHTASGTNDKRKVEVLIATGTDVNQTIVNGTTPLMVAAKFGHTDIIKVLIDADARIDQANNSGNTALMIAVQGRRPDAVEMLLRRNADPERKNRQNLSALDIARLMGYTEIVNIIEESLVPKG